MKLVECVPNFSEGRDQEVIAAIKETVESIAGVRVLDVDPGGATNRTVFTFAGPPEAMLEAAFQAIRTGTDLIDMRKHKGAHARQGACDVCPFVPIAGTTMEECIQLAKKLGDRVARELSIPIYLYAAAAAKPARVRLPDIRVGEYEGLKDKLKKPEWKPDFGPAKFNPKSGATAIGARNFLIAYNINLNSTNVKLAKDIAFTIRERGRLKRDKKGNKIIGKDGTAERVSGMFKNVQGTGWLIPEYNRAQVTVNILDIDASPVHKVYDACCDLAAKLGCRVTGSEIVGMVPKRVLVEAGKYFLKKQGSTTGIAEEELIRNGIISLGLNDVARFDPSKKIIEDRFKAETPLAVMPVKQFVDVLASSSPAPGGGSVAALAGALAAGLASMVAALTFDKKGYEKLKSEMEALGVRSQELKALQLKAMDDDTAAFNSVMESMRMPKRSKSQQEARSRAVQDASKDATLVPLRTLERVLPTLKCAKIAADKGNPNSLSDAGVAALMGRAAAYGAYYNILINLPGIEDKPWRKKIRAEADNLLKLATASAEKVEKAVVKKLRSVKS